MIYVKINWKTTTYQRAVELVDEWYARTMREIHDRVCTCPRCKITFLKPRPDAKFCSERCRKSLANRRNHISKQLREDNR